VRAAREPASRATVESVAAHAGVSRQTVSNALNAPTRLKPETLERVLAAVHELGYQPNHAARTLRTQATRVVGCRLLPETSGATGGVLDRFMHSLCAAARDRRYDVLVFTARNDDDEIATYEDLMRRNAVDGFVLAGTHFVDARTRWLIDRGAPFVAFGRPWGEERATHSWVDVDGAAGTAEAVDHLVSQGHRRIGFVGWPAGSGVGDDRRRGWYDAVRARKLPLRGLEVAGEDGIATGAALAGRLLDAAQPPTALVCVSDSMALGALYALEDRKLRPGPDVGVVGFDDSLVAGVVRPGLTSVRQPLEAVAEKVVELLLDDLAGGSGPPEHALVPPVLVVRTSSTR
jgi:DNA-binding LacI/PurR family transcriptional regulator